MKYFETKHERNSAKITALLALIILLLLFVVGPPYLDPPEEYGVAVNFGNSDVGSGSQPLSNPRKAEVPKVTEEVTPQPQSQPQKTSPKAEDVLTNETAESIAIRRQKEAEMIQTSAMRKESCSVLHKPRLSLRYGRGEPDPETETTQIKSSGKYRSPFILPAVPLSILSF